MRGAWFIFLVLITICLSLIWSVKFTKYWRVLWCVYCEDILNGKRSSLCQVYHSKRLQSLQKRNQMRPIQPIVRGYLFIHRIEGKISIHFLRTLCFWRRTKFAFESCEFQMSWARKMQHFHLRKEKKNLMFLVVECKNFDIRYPPQECSARENWPKVN